jgi:hypothetical protein
MAGCASNACSKQLNQSPTINVKKPAYMTKRLYFLLDGAMMDGTNTHLPKSLPDPSWLHPLYQGQPRAALGPNLVDAQAALDAGQFDAARDLCHVSRSRLHVSYLQSALTTEQMLNHLQQCTRVWLSNAEAVFLRFADCRVLPRLAAHLTPAQWRAIAGPMMKWEFHLRDGSRSALPLADAGVEAAPFPLVLSDPQIDALELAAQPDNLTQELRVQYGELPGNLQQQYDRASAALAIWRQMDGAGYDILLTLATMAFRSEGRALLYSDLPRVLAGRDALEVENILNSALKRTAEGQR